MKVYRSREGKVLGVCKGLADATGVPVKYLRGAAVVGAVISVPWTAAAYVAGAVLMPEKRPEGYEGEDFKEKFSDLKDEAEVILKKEFRDLKEALSRTQSQGEEEKSSTIAPEKG
jgi:phage shock protein C